MRILNRTHSVCLRKAYLFYNLLFIDPPTVEIVSLPSDPTEGQSVTLSCLAHGGMPEKGLAFSWWHSKDLEFPPTINSHNGGVPPKTQELSPILAKSLVSSLNASQLASIVTEQMTKIPDHTGRHLMLDGVSLEQTGWYGCQVTNGGGTARSLHLLLINCK